MTAVSAASKTPLTVRELQQTAWQNSEDHGFHEPIMREGVVRDASVPERLDLVVSELSEALEEYRVDDHALKGDWSGLQQVRYKYSWMTETSLSPTEVAPDGKTVYGKPIGFAQELADVMIRMGDLAQCYGIDLDAAIQAKHRFNATRPLMHGKNL